MNEKTKRNIKIISFSVAALFIIIGVLITIIVNTTPKNYNGGIKVFSYNEENMINSTTSITIDNQVDYYVGLEKNYGDVVENKNIDTKSIYFCSQEIKDSLTAEIDKILPVIETISNSQQEAKISYVSNEDGYLFKIRAKFNKDIFYTEKRIELNSISQELFLYQGSCGLRINQYIDYLNLLKRNLENNGVLKVSLYNTFNSNAFSYRDMFYTSYTINYYSPSIIEPGGKVFYSFSI